MAIGSALAAPQGDHNLAFVMNLSRLVDAESFALPEDHKLRRASADEIPAIRETLGRFMMVPTFNPWQERIGNGGQAEAMAEQDWRYHVISFTGTNHTILELEKAFKLARAELQIGFTFISVGGALSGLAWHSGRLFQTLDTLRSLTFFEIANPDIAEIAEIHAQLNQHDEQLLPLRRLLQRLQDLEAVPPSSQLVFLGYFALLESLLTHRPDPKDLYQSITRQVRTKIALLDSRFEYRLDYGPFGGALPDKVWTKMYEYRSILAHGDEASFDESLRLLGNGENAMKLLKDSVKSVMRQAVKEPQLLVDLREC